MNRIGKANRAAARGLQGFTRSALCCAIAGGLLLATAMPAAAQDAGQDYEEPGEIGDPDSWRTDEFLADWGLGAIGAEYAYARGLSGYGIQLGILDTGTSSMHEDFAGSGRLRAVKFTIDYGDGLVFEVDGGAGRLLFGDHGTHVGGTVAGGRNGSPTHGVAFGADLLAGSVGGIADSDALLPYILMDTNAHLQDQGLPSLTAGELRALLPEQWGMDFLSDIMASNFDALSEQGARVINNSWGYSLAAGSTFEDVAWLYEQIKDDPVFGAAVRAVREHDTLFVFAAGNDSSIDNVTDEVILTHTDPNGALPVFMPELADNWVTVVSLDEDLTRSSFSSICGEAKDWCLSAPGGTIAGSTFDPYRDSSFRLNDVAVALALANLNGMPGVTPQERLENLRQLIAGDPGWQQYFIYSGIDITQPGAFDDALHDLPGSAPESLYAHKSGTSMAAPHVTGALGLLMERYPYLDNTQVRDVMLTTATDLGVAGVDEIYGWGLLNLEDAINGPGQIRVDTNVVMDQHAGGAKVWEGAAWDDWSNNIGGTGRLTKSGIGWLRLSGDNSFGGLTVADGVLELTGSNSLGDTVVDGGLLLVNGLHANLLTVNAGGTVGGTGTVGDTVVGGAVAPGSNGLGTLNVDGDYTQLAGSTFVAEVAPPHASDHLAVNGSADLQGGTVQVVRAPGEYLLGQSYDILSAAGGVDGQFDAVDGSLVSPFLAFDLRYGANTVALDVLRGMALAEAAQTRNQRAVATAADAMADTDPLLLRLTQLFPAEAVEAFDAMSGEYHPSMRSVLVDSSRNVRDAALARAMGPVRPVPAHGDGGAAWVQVFGTGGQLDGDGNAAALDYDGSGTLVGIEHDFGYGWRLGALGGIERNDLRLPARHSEGDVRSRHLGVYVGREWRGWGLRAGAAHARHDVDSERTVAFPGVDQYLTSEYRARTTQAFFEGGYRFGAGDWNVQPFLQYAHVRVETECMAETGGSLALVCGDSDTSVNLTTAGMRFDVGLRSSGQSASWLRWQSMLGWRHASGDVTPEARLSWRGGQEFTVAGAPVADGAMLVETGFGAWLGEDTLLELNYSGQFADEAHDHGLNARLSYRF